MRPRRMMRDMQESLYIQVGMLVKMSRLSSRADYLEPGYTQ
jgi:hypothetical protein